MNLGNESKSKNAQRVMVIETGVDSSPLASTEVT